MAKKLDSKTTYILEMKDGSLKKITVPSTWRLTFGLTHPGQRDGSYSKETALRLYAGNSQKAVFTGVATFRDTSIEIEERVTETKQQMASVDTPDGKREMVVEAHIHSWRNPDDNHQPGKQFLKLPGKVNRDDLIDE